MKIKIRNKIQIKVIDGSVDILLSNWGIFPDLYEMFLLGKIARTDKKTLEIEEAGDLLREKGGSDLDFISFFDRVIKWGGSTGERVRGNLYKKLCKNGISKKDANVIIAEAIRKSAECLKKDKIECAIEKMINLDGLDVSYGSKILRMLSPENAGVYDSVLAKYLPYNKDVEDKKKKAENYAKFCTDCQKVVGKLKSKGIKKKNGGEWRVADVEAVLFFVCFKKQKIEVTYEF